MADPHKYTDEDVKAVIERALDGQAGGQGSVTHADLLAIGEQVGIAPHAMESAARQVLESRREHDARRQVMSGRKRWLVAHAGVFAALNGLFFTVNALTTPGEWWALFPVVFWGLALAIHAGLALAGGVSTRRLQQEIARSDAQRLERGTQLRVAETPPRSEQSEDAADGADSERPQRERGANSDDL